ncbi:ISAon1 family transposase [Pontibacter kalidii]|uniref:ISAon1 family transposase n=1 Tax=Pontibacter kalidii TaxID=2592049 RepID=UPI002B1CB26C|nr:transposase [Pontibacter kalidii]
MDNTPVSCRQLASYFHLDGKQLQEQYKEHTSHFHQWEQREHASDWMRFPQNVGQELSIDETALSNGELYTILTNKAAKGRKGALVAMVRGTQAEDIITVLEGIPQTARAKVREVTLDMAKAVRGCFPKACRVIDRFHVQKLAYEAVQELRIKYRWQALDEENQRLEQAKRSRQRFDAEVLSNGDTLKQLLARSRYLLFKHRSRWSASQKERADMLFYRYPLLGRAYDLAMELGQIFTYCKSKQQAFKRLAIWYNEVEASGIDSFRTVARSVQNHYEHILNFFNNRSTNASAESFNAKVKAFRATFRGVRDTTFFLFRLANIYA